MKITAETGFVLSAVIFALAIMGLLAVMSLKTANDERRSSRALRESGAALYAAEAGLNITRASWDSAVINAIAPGDSIDGDWQVLSGGASYRAVITRYDGGAQRMLGLTVQGRGAGVWGGRRTITAVFTEIQSMGWAMFGRDGIEIEGGEINGDLGSNGSLLLSGAGALVAGNAIVGGTVSDPSKVEGYVVEGADPTTLDPVACPATPYGPVPTSGTVSFSSLTGDISLSGTDDITFSSGTYYFNNFTKSGTADMVVPLGAVVQIYLSGALTVAGNGFVNGNSNSSSLQVWGCGADASPWSISGKADVAMIVYAPDHDLTISGSGDRLGSFTGATLLKTGKGDLATDFTLASPTGIYVVLDGSWTQLLN